MRLLVLCCVLFNLLGLRERAHKTTSKYPLGFRPTERANYQLRLDHLLAERQTGCSNRTTASLPSNPSPSTVLIRNTYYPAVNPFKRPVSGQQLELTPIVFRTTTAVDNRVWPSRHPMGRIRHCYVFFDAYYPHWNRDS